MSFHLKGWLRWLYPGMRVKRWTLLTLLSTGFIVLALLEVLGKERVGEIYRLFPLAGTQRYVLIGLLFTLGVAGFILGLFRLVRSVARGVAPGRTEKTSDIIYRTRVLERGPRVVALGGGTGLSTSCAG